ncbi:MAG: GWxTD domain-containing protein, partial [Sphingobacteriales bacterium]
PNGVYNMFLFVNDEADSFSKANIELPLQVSVAKDRIQMADILFCDTLYPATQPDVFTRYGFNFIPSVSNIMEKNKNSLLFYSEIYNTLAANGQGKFKTMVSVRNTDGSMVKGFEKIRTQKNNNLNYLFDAVDISKLPGGEYYLRIAVLDKDNNAVAQRDKYFIKLTDSFLAVINTKNSGIHKLSAQEIKDFVPYMEPIVSSKDLENFRRASAKDSSALAIWFYNFWKAKNPEDPELEYTNYMQNVTYVQENFNTMISKGYRTDRGRIYLKYGKPGYVAPYIDEPNAYPYEIWHYYKTSTRNNVKFIFYNPTQLNNDYILLHSEMPSEKQNPNWKRMIYKRIDKSKSLDDEKTPGNFGDGIDSRIRE